jgi:NADH-quinone oxidoreductase subunit C
MTLAISGEELAKRIEEANPGTTESSDNAAVWVTKDSLLSVCTFLKTDSSLSFDYLVSISAVDYIEYFEVVYHLVSIQHNHSSIIKTKCWGREHLEVDSIIHLWQGADFQEREIYDLMGIQFTNHPNLKRLMLWEGFPGNPQRKDYLEAPR